MQTRICLTCRFQGNLKVTEPRPCAHCISRGGFSRWEPLEQKTQPEQEKQTNGDN